jgi:hypothetical protein
MDEFDLPIMDRSRRRLAGEDDAPPTSNPIAGPPRPFALRISTGTLAAVVVGLAALLLVMLRGLPAPLAIATDATPTAEAVAAPTRAAIPTVADAAPPTSGPGRIAAWWAPGGDRTAGDLSLDAISGPVARCATSPELVQVALRTGSDAPWVLAEDAGIGPELLAVLPDAGGVCALPTATPAPVYVAPPAEAPAVQASPVVEAPAPEPTPCGLVLVGAGCKPLVLAP